MTDSDLTYTTSLDLGLDSLNLLSEESRVEAGAVGTEGAEGVGTDGAEGTEGVGTDGAEGAVGGGTDGVGTDGAVGSMGTGEAVGAVGSSGFCSLLSFK